MATSKEIKIAKTCIKDFDYSIEDIKTIFNDCIACCDCEFCFFGGDNKLFCAITDLELNDDDLIEHKNCIDDIKFDSYDYYLDLIHKYGK